MKTLLLAIVLFFCTTQIFYSQEDGVVSLALPVRNSLTFNQYVINPTFSFVREQNKYISIYNKREWVQFEDAPQTYLASYSGRFNENMGIGVGLFQQNYGVLTTFGGILNFAYNARLGNENNLTFGLNVGAYKSGINSGKVVTNFSDPSLENIPSNFLLTVNPGINYGTGFLDFGVSINNLVLYNIKSSELIKDDSEQSIQAHIMYTGYMDSSGFFDESKFSGLVRSEFAKDQTTLSGIVMLTVPKGIWAQVGYNTLYGASAGLGLNITQQIAIEYSFEKALGNLTDFGPSHEITLAYRFKNKDSYRYSGDDEIGALISSENKRSPVVSKPKVDAATRAKLAEEAKTKADAKAIADAEAKAVLEADQQAKAKLLLEEKAKADAIAKTKSEAEAQAKLEAEAIANAEAKAIAEEVAAAKTKLAAEAKRKADEAKAMLEAKAIAEAKAKAEANILAKEKAAAQAQLEAQAKAVAEAKAKQDAEAKAQLEAQLATEAKAKAELEAQNKLEAAAQAKLDDAAKLAAEAEAQTLLAAQAQAKLDAEVAAKTKADAEAQSKLDEAAKLAAEAQNKPKSEINPTDDIGLSMKSLAKLTEDIKITQDELLTQLSEAVANKNNDLKNLKEENDLSEKGIFVEPKPFKSITEENNNLEAIKVNLDNIIKDQNQKITELEDLYNDRIKIVPLENDTVNLYYQKAIKKLKSEQLTAIRAKADLVATLADIKIATEFERKRRIKRAAYDNEEDRYNQDKATLKIIKQNTSLSATPLKAEDFDFGEEQSSNIQILKNIKNVESGYYAVVAVHSDVAKRDDFLRKAVAAGESNINFFYDVNTSKYFIYYEKMEYIEQTNEALKSKGTKPYNGKMSIVKIEN